MSEKLRIGELRKGTGNVLCWADVTCFECITIRDVKLYQTREGVICLGLPQREYTDSKGEKRYWGLVLMTEGAKEGLRKRLHRAYLDSPLSDADGTTTICRSEEADPW